MEAGMDRSSDSKRTGAVPLQIRLLGGIDVSCTMGRTDQFRTNKGRALLAYVVVEGRVLHREHLGTLLWPDMTTARSRANLSRVLSNLRQLVPGYLLTDRETVQFDTEGPYTLDLDRFNQRASQAMADPEGAFDAEPGRQALALYRGDFMADFTLPNCPTFEEWVAVQRERVHRQALRLLDQLIQHHMQRGEFAVSQAYVQRALALEPWREETYRQAMLVAALRGERTQALRYYATCCRVLAEALNVQPSKETQQLQQRIRVGRVQPLAVESSPHHPLLPLVGRSEAYAWLLARWNAARRGDRGLTLIAGEAGIGKTRLVEEVLNHVAGQGATLLRGRCYEFSTTVPYQAINEALTAHLASATSGTLTVPKAVAAELAHILPVIRRLMPKVEPAPHHRDAEARTHLFDSFAYLLRTLPRPVLFLDDLHWADADTLDLLQYLIRAPNRHPLWLVGTYRPEETPLGHPLTGLRRALSRDARVYERTLRPLTADDVEQLTADLVIEPDRQPLTIYLMHQSEGNPFVLQEVLNSLREQERLIPQDSSWRLVGDLNVPTLPERVQDVVMRRVSRLPIPARWALNYAAVIAQPFAPDLLADVLGETQRTVADALRAGESRHLIQKADDRTYHFVHDRIRETLYRQLSDHVCKLMHERVGQTLLDTTRSTDGVPDDVAVQIAHHFERSLVPTRALPYLQQAAQAAQHAYAHETAINYYQRMLPLLTEEARIPVVSALVQLWARLGQWERAKTLIRQALVMVKRLDLPAEEAGMEFWLSQIQDNQGEYQASLASARRAEAAARRAGPGAEEQLALAINRQAWAHYRLADTERALRAAQDARALSERLAYPRGITASLNLLSAIHNHRGHYDKGFQALTLALEIYRREGERLGETQMLSNLCYTAYQQGAYDVAIEYGDQALPIARKTGARYMEMLCLTNLGGAEVAIGLDDKAEAYLKEVLAYPESRHWFMLTEVHRYLAEVHLSRGEPERALDAGRQALTLAQDAQTPKYEAAAWRVIAEIAAALPDPPMIDDARWTPDACFHRALDLFTDLAMPGEQAWTLWRWANHAYTQGHTTRADDLTRQAQALAAHLDLHLPIAD
jgi:predicted ATPase/DNA-binding SARP family transcriptional activator